MCGILIQGVECVLFQSDGGVLYTVETTGSFQIGSRVRVRGFLDPSCITFCQQGDGCIRDNTIEVCGEGEELLCDVLAEITLQWEDFRTDFSIADDDVDMDGLPEEAILLLLDAVCTMEPRAGLSSAVSHAYDINLAELDLEANSAALAPYRKALAALFSTSVRIRQILTQSLKDFGIQLAGTYDAVTEVDGTFLPVPTQLANGAAGFLVANGATKAIDEPFSGAGDLDGDDESNANEYDRVVTQGGGTVEDFASAAADSGNTVDPPGSGTCAAVPGGTGTPNPMDVAAVLSVALALGWIGRRRARATLYGVEMRCESSL
jgi:hypothetical protein